MASALALLFSAAPSRAEEVPLTRVRIAELVTRAPSTQVARAEAAVAGAAVTAAGTLSLENPVLSGMGGVRFNPDGSKPFNAVATVSWPVDLGGKRGARVDAAKAEFRAAIANATKEERDILLDALLRHALVLRDERQLAIATARHVLSERVYAAAQQRHAAGSVPELDVVLAAMQERQDASLAESARGARDANTLLLATILGISEGARAEGSLVPAGDPPPAAALLGQIDQRPEVRLAQANLDAAQARVARERAQRVPTIDVLAQYERDDYANIALIGLAIPLPILNPNRVGVATSRAEVPAAKVRLTRSRTALQGKVRELYARYQATKAAMDSLAPTAALATKAVTLATRGYELGENDLASVLLVRREAIGADTALLEAQHAHALAKIELFVIAGRVPE